MLQINQTQKIKNKHGNKDYGKTAEIIKLKKCKEASRFNKTCYITAQCFPTFSEIC